MSLSRLLDELDALPLLLLLLLLVPFFTSSPRFALELLLLLPDLWYDDEDDLERLDDELDEELFDDEPPLALPPSSFFLSGVEGFDEADAVDDDDFLDLDEDDEEAGSDLCMISPNRFLN